LTLNHTRLKNLLTFPLPANILRALDQAGWISRASAFHSHTRKSA